MNIYVSENFVINKFLLLQYRFVYGVTDLGYPELMDNVIVNAETDYIG